MAYRGLTSGSQGTRLNTVSSSRGMNYTYAYDGLGNVSNNGRHTFSFDNASRMGGVSNLGISYFYDGRGHRIVERSGSETKITLRSEKGDVLYQQNVNQNMAYKYYRLGSMLVAESEDPCTINCGQMPVLAPRTVDADHSLSQADIYISQTSSALSGALVTYELRIGNNGPDAASNVEFRHAIPDGAFARGHTISKGVCSVSGLSMVCQIGQLASGESVTFTGAISGLSLDDYAKTAVSRVISTTEDPNPSNNAIVHKSGGGSICTTEQAVAGTVAENSMDILRDYRDNVLAKSAFGQDLIDGYYRSSPALVKSMQEHQWLLYYMRGIVAIFFVIALIGLSPMQWIGVLIILFMGLATFGYLRRMSMFKEGV